MLNFDDLAPDNYDYTVSKDSYEDTKGDVDIVNENVTKEVTLLLSAYEVSGKVIDGLTEEGLSGVVLSFGDNYVDETRDDTGDWSKSGLIGEVKIVPQRTGFG